MINTGTFSAIEQVSGVLSLTPGQAVEIILTNSGGHAWRVDLESMTKGNAGHKLVQSFSGDTASTLYRNTTSANVNLRLRSVTLNSGAGDTVAYTLQDTVPVAAVQLVISGSAKVGTTAGWVVGAANNLGKIATLPKAITAGTLVVQIPRIAVGDRIVGAYLVGSLQGASTKHTTILLDIRSLTAATAGATDASVSVMAAALDVQANTVMSKTNTPVAAVSHVVAEGESFYALITATTADDNACTASLMAVVLQIVPA